MIAGTLAMPLLTWIGWRLSESPGWEGFQWLGAAYPLLIHPVLEPLFGSLPPGRSASRRSFAHDLMLACTPFVQGVILVTALLRMGEAGPAASPLGSSQDWALAIGCGMSAGVYGVTSAHELIHRARRFERHLGSLQLLLCGFIHFKIQHLQIHHRWVATPRDPASARRGESLYAYWLRSIAGGWLACWKCDPRRMLRDQGLQLGVWLAVGALFGPRGLLLFGVQAALAILLLSTVDYLEHYGLARREISADRYEPFTARHAWEARQRLTNFTLFNLGLHPAHHLEAARPYTDLETRPEAPQLPMGYSAALLAALVPPLWKKIIHPRLDRS